MSRVSQATLDETNRSLPEQEPQRAMWTLDIPAHACDDDDCTGGHTGLLGIVLRPDGRYILGLCSEDWLATSPAPIVLREEAKLLLTRHQLIAFITDCQEAVNLGGHGDVL